MIYRGTLYSNGKKYKLLYANIIIIRVGTILTSFLNE